MSVNQIGSALARPAEAPAPVDRTSPQPAPAAAPAAAAEPGDENRQPSALEQVRILAEEGDRVRQLKLRIELDQASGRFVYFGVDIDSGEVVRQYPPKEALARIAFYREIAGLLLDRST